MNDKENEDPAPCGTDKSFVDIVYISKQLQTKKDKVLLFIKKNFPRHILLEVNRSKSFQHGGHNRKDYYVSHETYQLIIQSYRGRYKPTNINTINPCLMSLEHGSIGFLDKLLDGITQKRREYKVGQYRIDLYLFDQKLCIECDEFNHKNYNVEAEEKREQFIIKTLGCHFYRFNPNDENFKLENIANDILRIILKK